MNGATKLDTAPLAGWFIVQTNGLTLIGRGRASPEEPDKLVGLSPVFEIKASLEPTRDGVGVMHACFPLWLLGVEGLPLPPGAIAVPTEAFSPRKRAYLSRSVDKAVEMQAAAKRADLGIVLATKMPEEKKP